ncbi:MAG: acetyl-CoA hydrolase/transferase C-terminal domain-containing protein [Actinomycetota bacterium]|jgi:acyl-CoA hydrolase|nr:acetyl-CoA hydrolase/transferase C-terminal domain-containing protein [Actinomycetota bacterium]
MEVVSQAIVAERLEALAPNEPRIVVSGNFATPWELVHLAAATIPVFRFFVLNPQAGWPRREGIITETPFVGEGVRSDDDLKYLPMRLSLVPRLFATSRPPDVVMIQTSTPRNGKVSLGIETNLLPAAIEEVRRRGGLVIAQLNRHMPYTFGDSEIVIDDVDLALEVDVALPSPAQRRPDEAALIIGENVASLSNDGSTLQLGIGQLPDAALDCMHHRRHLGVWSEMVSDGIMKLDRAGAIDVNRVMTSTFLFGSPEMYQWADENPRLVMRRTEVANNPARIAEQPGMLSINTALQVDLYAQSNASFVRGRIYSGFGGQPDFVSGALHSRGGQAVLALRSWHDKSDASNIIPLLTNPVCSFQHSVIVTEQGIAPIFGFSQQSQARSLIDHAAHPRAREELSRAAQEMFLLGSD